MKTIKRCTPGGCVPGVRHSWLEVCLRFTFYWDLFYYSSLALRCQSYPKKEKIGPLSKPLKDYFKLSPKYHPSSCREFCGPHSEGRRVTHLQIVVALGESGVLECKGCIPLRTFLFRKIKMWLKYVSHGLSTPSPPPSLSPLPEPKFGLFLSHSHTVPSAPSPGPPASAQPPCLQHSCHSESSFWAWHIPAWNPPGVLWVKSKFPSGFY